MRPAAAVNAWGSPLVLVWLLSVPMEGQAQWKPRAPRVKPGPTHQLRDLTRWPQEPAEPPQPLELRAFEAALAHVCGTSRRELPRRLGLKPARLMQAAWKTQVDAFLLSALVAHRSQCNGRYRKAGAVGLLAIEPRMYAGPPGAPLPFHRRQLAPSALLRPAHNLKVGAQVLKMWLQQHAAIDAQFGGADHRTAVAHLYWGDRVGGSGVEDLVWTLRRRMLSHYRPASFEAVFAPSLGLHVTSPLEGVPRVATSGLGEPRDDGRWHRGLDITGMVGEPVTAVASGTVIFAGVNLPGRPRLGSVAPQRLRRYRRRALGAGGIYLCISHDAAVEVVSCYMHLNDYNVHTLQRVSSGERIATLGDSGIAHSLPHLHLEIRKQGQAIDAAEVLKPFIIPPEATLTHKRLKQRLRQARREARREDRREARAAKAAHSRKPAPPATAGGAR